MTYGTEHLGSVGNSPDLQSEVSDMTLHRVNDNVLILVVVFLDVSKPVSG